MPNKMVQEGILQLDGYEDSHQAMITELYFDDPPEVFVRVQSWSEKHDHSALEKFAGRRVRITIEVLD